jgi:hypothetical protein
MDPVRIQEIVREEAGHLLDVCNALPPDAVPAIMLAMVHTARAVQEAAELDGIDRIPSRALSDAETQLIQIARWIDQHAAGVQSSRTVADQVTATLDAQAVFIGRVEAENARNVRALETYKERNTLLQTQLDRIYGWLSTKAVDYTLEGGTDTADITIKLLDFFAAEIVAKDAAYFADTGDLRRQRDNLESELKAANSRLGALGRALASGPESAPGLPSTWSPSAEVR